MQYKVTYGKLGLILQEIPKEFAPGTHPNPELTDTKYFIEYSIDGKEF